MTETNADVVRGMYAAFARGEVAAVLAALDPDIEWREAENFIYAAGNPYRGPDAVLEGVFQRLAAEWDSFGVSPTDVLDAGDAAVGYGYYSGVHRTTGKAVRAQFCHMFWFRDGKVSRFQQYTDTLQFQEAVTG